MKPQLLHFGESRSPVIVVDDFCGAIASVVDIAAGLSPFPPAGTYYPGLRRIIVDGDEAASRYVFDMMQMCAQFVGGAYDVDRFDLIEASFSMVTAQPATLQPAQRAPHFDSTNQMHFAVLHFLSQTPATGTAFYRQRTTGIERVNDGNIARFVDTAARESEHMVGYTNGSNAHFEQIGMVESIADRLVIYQGSLLHSGIIPGDMNYSDDPREGRLTANIFITGHQD